MSYEIRATAIDELLATGQELFAANWDESGTKARFCLLDDIYRQWAAAGVLCSVGAWHGDELVGYAVATVVPHAHTGLLAAMVDAIYVSPPHRGDLHAEIMRVLGEEAAQRGALELLWAAKPGSAMDHIMRRRGLELREHLYVQELF